MESGLGIVLRRGELSQQRRHLSWARVDKECVFEGPKGTETLAQLFADKSQLIAYHFTFAPDWDAGCPRCSFIGLEHDPEKWKPVFRKDHAQTER